MLLKGRTAVVTGNPYGIGRATADLFTREGARVFCIDDGRDGWDEGQGPDGTRPDLVADVADVAAIDSAARQVERELGQVDILFNLAGRAARHTFETTTPEVWHEMVSRNLTAAFLCSQRFLPLMRKHAGGSIIHHASIDGFLGNPALAAYSAAKGGLIPLTHVMAHDLGKYGIRVNCISTGGIREGAPRPVDATLAALTPTGRLGTPEDVARAALYLASDWAGYVNGVNLVLDGGRTTITQGCG